MKIKCTLGNIDQAIKAIEQYEKSLEKKEKVFLKRLAEIGVETARVSFQEAQYDGDNDVVVHDPKWIDENRLVISATGKSVAFIEFGTGVHYAAESHPKAAELGMVRGGFGYHLGLLDSWRYEGNPGKNGKMITKGKHAGEIETYGNPANRCLYEAGEEMRRKIKEIAKEAFGND